MPVQTMPGTGSHHAASEHGPRGEPGPCEHEAPARGDRGQELLDRHAGDVREGHQVLRVPRCEAEASDSAFSNGVAWSYSSWRFHQM